MRARWKPPGTSHDVTAAPFSGGRKSRGCPEPDGAHLWEGRRQDRHRHGQASLGPSRGCSPSTGGRGEQGYQLGRLPGLKESFLRDTLRVL